MSMKDEDGTVLTNIQQVLTRWKEHTEDMYRNPEGPRHGRRFLSRKTEEEPEPLMEEIRDAVKKLKNRKLPGCDGVPAELWKAAGEWNQTLVQDMRRHMD